MLEYWRKDSPKEWDLFFKQDFEFMKKFHERHIPINPNNLKQWQDELDKYHKGTSYGETLKQDIKWAKKCNARQDEVLLFYEST